MCVFLMQFFFFLRLIMNFKGFLRSSVGKESACNVGDLSSIPGSGRSPGEGNGNPIQDSCLENSMHRGAQQVTVHGITRVGHDLVTNHNHQNELQEKDNRKTLKYWLIFVENIWDKKWNISNNDILSEKCVFFQRSTNEGWIFKTATVKLIFLLYFIQVCNHHCISN